MSENNRKNIPWTEEEYLLALIVYQDLKRCGEAISASISGSLKVSGPGFLILSGWMKDANLMIATYNTQSGKMEDN